MSDPVLSVRNLRVEFPGDDGVVTAVDDVSFDVFENEVVGIVGESGSGKSVTSMAIMGLLPKRARTGGEVFYRGRSIRGLPENEIRRLRGSKIAMVFQDALTALDPVYTVGDQIAEAITAHDRAINKKVLQERVTELLNLVGIPNPSQRVDQYPHEYSGGMRQRAMIAMSIANEPDVLIADEPTTALDVTIQAQILDLLRDLRRDKGVAVVLITHDLGVVAGLAEDMSVLYAGRIVEQGRVPDIYRNPRHPYTRGLLASLPKVNEQGHEALTPIEGAPPSLLHVPSGCAFHPRCPRKEARCTTEDPRLRVVGPVRSACHFAEDLDREPAGAG